MQAILGLLAKPILGSLTDAYRAKLESGNNKTKIAAELAARELEVQKAEVDAHRQIRIAQTGTWYTVENLAGYILVFALGKVYIWDAALHLGTSDAVKGAMGEWGMIILSFFFAKRGIENVARIMKG